MPFTDEAVFDAMEIFRKEFQAWTIAPDKGSEFNDQGHLKYERYWVHDLNRPTTMPAPPGPVAATFTFERHLLSAEAAREYPTFRAVKAVMEHVRAS